MGDNVCPFGSVGAIVKKGDDYLVLYRASFPPGLAGVAGHIDPGESPEEAMKRELLEEAGITALSLKEVLHDTLPNPCKKGFTSHEWWVYEVAEWAGDARLIEPDKHTFVRFMSIEEIRDYLKRDDMDPAWKMLFAALGVV